MKAVRLFADTGALVDAALAAVLGTIRGSIAERGRCRIALAGGNSPRSLYQRLAKAELDWSALHLFFGDERCVPPDHASSNYRMAYEALFRHVAIPEAQVHRIRGELLPEEAARSYNEVLGSEPLDLVLLGMGRDGHTASLFPGGPELEERERLVVASKSPIEPRDRVSLSLAALNSARTVLFLVAGADKAGRLALVWRELEDDAPTCPAAMVRPASGELHWYLDAAAGQSAAPTA